MNILIANNQEFNPQIGGVEKASHLLCQELLAHNHKVFLTACNRSPYSASYTPVAPQLISDSVEEVVSYIQINQISHIINQAGTDSNYCAFIAQVASQSHCKLISVLHADPFFRYKTYRGIRTGVLRDFIKKMIIPFRDVRSFITLVRQYHTLSNQCDSIVLLSERYVQRFKKYLSISNRSLVTVIPNACPYKISDAYNKEKVVLYLGRIDQGKAVHRLVHIWKHVVLSHPDWNLHIVGNGPQKRELETIVENQHIPNIVFKDNQPPISEYTKASIICMTSRFEGLPMVLIEAMAFGCIPVSYNSFSSVYDLINHEENGFIIPDGNSKKYIKCLSAIMDSKYDIASLSYNAQKKSLAFQPEIIYKKWDQLLHSI